MDFRLLLMTLLVAFLAACTATRSKQYLATGEPPLCRSSTALGRVAVLPETAWRSDQKEPAERTAMAARAVARAFSGSRCLDRFDVRPFADWSSQVEGDRLAVLSREGVETAVFVRVEELGPTLAVTLSLPFLWIGSTEAEVHLRAIHIPTRRVIVDARVKRSTGGPFQLRPASWAEAELVAALRVLLVSASSNSFLSQ